MCGDGWEAAWTIDLRTSRRRRTGSGGMLERPYPDPLDDKGSGVFIAVRRHRASRARRRRVG